MNSIFHRISVRKYEDKPVEKEKIMEILKAGMQAPSACNQQPWEFYVVTDKEKIQKLSKVTPYTGCAAGAPAVIVPVGSNMYAGNEDAIRQLDIGGLIVTVQRLINDTEYIRRIKEEFVFGGFNKKIQGSGLELEDISWD